MSITYTDNLQLISYNDLKGYITINSALDSLLPKDDLISVEGEDIARYDYLKEQIKLNGVTTPFYITGLGNEALLIDGLTRWGIVTELVAEGLINPDDNLFTVRIYEGFASLEEIMSWMWSFNQSVRGAINNPKLDTIMMGIKYNLSKTTRGGNRKSKGQRVTLKNTSKELSEIFDVNQRTVKRAGSLVENLHTLAGLYNLASNELYYLYEEGVSQDRIAKLACIVKGSDDYKKLEKYIITKDSKAISLFITEKELKQIRLEKKEKEKNYRLAKAKEANHLSNICKLYSEEVLTLANIDQIKRLERRLTKQEEKQWFFSGIKEINSKESFTKLIIQTKQQFPLLQNNNSRKLNKPQSINSTQIRETSIPPSVFTEDAFKTFDISTFNPTDKELTEKTVRKLNDIYYDLSSNPITKGLEENLNTLITLINNRLEEYPD